MKKNTKDRDLLMEDSPYIEITNKTQSCIVINSCHLVIKPMGVTGDSIIIDKSKISDSDIIGLHSAGLIKIAPPNAKKIKRKKEILIKEKKTRKPRKSKVALNDKQGASVTYIDHGKVKKGKMTRSIQDLHIIDPSGNNEATNDSEIIDVDKSEDKSSDAFIDSK